MLALRRTAPPLVVDHMVVDHHVSRCVQRATVLALVCPRRGSSARLVSDRFKCLDHVSSKVSVGGRVLAVCARRVPLRRLTCDVHMPKDRQQRLLLCLLQTVASAATAPRVSAEPVLSPQKAMSVTVAPALPPMMHAAADRSPWVTCAKTRKGRRLRRQRFGK